MFKINNLKIKISFFIIIFIQCIYLFGEEKPKIIAGPYLIAPTDSGMTVMWETDKPIKSKIRLLKDNIVIKSQEVKLQRGMSTQDYPDGICLYKVNFNKLKENTKYNYEITTSSGENIESHFKTLRKNPESARFIVITDTHNFDTASELTKVILKEKPEFIIHTGDMVLGTGYQKSQFNTYWFDKAKDFLKCIPVIYAPGNHDHGPFVNDYFTKPQSQIYNSDSSGNNISFNYGNIHFILMDSNPWGLLKSGAVKAGLHVDREVGKQVTDTKNWLINDLKSEEAKKAKWRLLFMHHPYVDDLTRTEIAPLAEQYGVNVLFAGHKHKYYKNVSINPQIGAKTLYIDLPAALKHESKIVFTKNGKPPVSGFPEIFAEGLGDFGIVTGNNNILNIEMCSLEDGKAGEFNVLDSTDIVSDTKEQIDFTNIKIVPDTINAGENIIVTTEAENISQGIAAVSININDDNEIINKYVFGSGDNAHVIVLNPGETKKIIAEIPLYKTGLHKIVFNKIEKNITVIPSLSKLVYKNLTVKRIDEEHSNIVSITANICNAGSKPAELTIPVYINNAPVADKKISLKPFETQKISFSHLFTDSGSYTIKLGNSESISITIPGILSGTPYLIDKSGNNNNGLIRGNPVIVKSPYGKALFLDGRNDYIEIADSSSLRFDNSWTGIVLAEPIRIVEANEKDHNPLLQKGPSIGWGPNYTVRMALRRSGLMTFGTSIGADEFFWDGGEYPLNKWSFYTAVFSKEEGGKGYINTEQVAATKLYGDKSRPIQNWINYPLFCGFSYIGHVDQKFGRALQYTMFNGKIGEIRFYNEMLTDNEIDEINKKPNSTGPKEKHMVTWLTPSEIETEGSYISDWRMPVEFTPSYKEEKNYWNWNSMTVKADIPDKTGITGRIQISDDGKFVRDSMPFTLENGLNSIDMTKLTKGQFVRVKLQFNSNFELDKKIQFPQVDKILIKASKRGNNTELKWSTETDWQKGLFKGAIGFQPKDRFSVEGLTGADFYH